MLVQRLKIISLFITTLKCFSLFSFLRQGVLLYSLGWPQTHHVARLALNAPSSSITSASNSRIFSFLVGLGFELRASHLQSSSSTTWAMPPVHFVLVILEMGVSQTICSGWPQTLILLISVSQVASVIGMSHCQKANSGKFALPHSHAITATWGHLSMIQPTECKQE
jgi:hypothetical protein